MQLRQLEHVVAVVSAGSFSAAARNLRIAQPTLSRSIAQLESSLGLRLFERAEAGARATAVGVLLASRGEEILGSIAALTEELQGLARGAHGRLRVGVGPASKIRPLPQFAAVIARTEPHLQLEMRQDSGRAIVEGLSNGQYDIVLTFSENAVEHGDLIRHKLFEDRIVAVVRPGHPLQGSGKRRLDEMADHPVASFRLASDFSPGELSRAQQANLQALMTDDGAMIRQFALYHGHIGLAPRFLFEDLLADGRVVELELDAAPVYDCWLLVARRSWALPLAGVLAGLVRRELAEPSPPQETLAP
ncbi:LysR family transcriptional regulator [Caulobacter sp. CCNWLY153]|uniref:LysR family transcriptional regulator n=1 Tax=unclassified Caulobacter TaxID=2648921 RepID=UPI002FEEC5F8